VVGTDAVSPAAVTVPRRHLSTIGSPECRHYKAVNRWAVRSSSRTPATTTFVVANRQLHGSPLIITAARNLLNNVYDGARTTASPALTSGHVQCDQ